MKFTTAGAEPVFVDSNVLLYAVDEANPVKADTARRWLAELWASGAGRISWQVLHEFYWNAVRKHGAPVAQARKRVAWFAAWDPIGVSFDLVQRAWRWCDRSGISYWDALIVAAALHSGARMLLTEDLQNGRTFDNCRIVNPFLTEPPNPASPL